MNHQTENLYDKLNNVHATLRKQKEDAFRTKQLAEQRYAIQRADRENMEKKCAETRAKLVSLKERAVEMKNVNAALEEKNKHVKREVCVSLLALGGGDNVEGGGGDRGWGMILLDHAYSKPHSFLTSPPIPQI